MELIYADKNGRDIGIITDFDFDISFGEKENDFEFSMPLDAHCCEEGYFLYVDGTEFGGVVDTIRCDINKNTVTYIGRSWHGILSHAIIQPKSKKDYYRVQGDANDILKTLIKKLGLGDIFLASEEESEVYIFDYQFDRYVDAYTGIRKMLADFSGKLKITHKGNKVMLEAVPLIDYTASDTWDSSQLTFKLQKTYRPCNHLICLGTGNLRKRHVIHLFTDENGGIQPYTTSDNPVEDSNYILTEDNQLIFGIDEVCEAFDYSSANDTENYIILTSQPKNWKNVFSEYYVIGDDEEYTNAEATEEDVEKYVKVATQPAKWSKYYSHYFKKNSDGTFSNLEAVVTPATTGYKRLTKEPNDWAKHCTNYYYYWSDGVTEEYRQVSKDSYTKTVLQTVKPSDWNTNYYRYYRSKANGGYEQIPEVAEGKKIPSWKPNKYYTKITKYRTPDFDKKVAEGVKYYYTYIKTKETESAPTFVANKYYEFQEYTKVHNPAWAKNTYYRKATDHYADLVARGIERLQSLWETEKIDLNLSDEYEYSVGDIVGAKDNVTGLEIVQFITQKNVVVKSGQINIKYKMGGK